MKRMRWWGIGGLVVVLAAAGPAESLPSLNQRVLAFARSQKGKKVGDGQCSALAAEALRSAGAQVRFHRDAEGSGPVWGEEVASLADALPGDILQFHDVTFKGSTTYADGSFRRWTQTFPHHTAIVVRARNTSRGLVFNILQQNVTTARAKRYLVQEQTLRMSDRQKGGWIKLYRPVAAREDQWP